MTTVIFWFRNDLRLHDQPALAHAIALATQQNATLLPVYATRPHRPAAGVLSASARTAKRLWPRHWRTCQCNCRHAGAIYCNVVAPLQPCCPHWPKRWRRTIRAAAISSAKRSLRLKNKPKSLPCAPRACWSAKFGNRACCTQKICRLRQQICRQYSPPFATQWSGRRCRRVRRCQRQRPCPHCQIKRCGRMRNVPHLRTSLP